MGVHGKVSGRPAVAVLPRRLTLLGPAFIAAVAYVDPGNVATNVLWLTFTR